MAKFQMDVSLDMSWRFEVEADDEDLAYEELWKIIGYDGEDLVDMSWEIAEAMDSENFDVSARQVNE